MSMSAAFGDASQRILSFEYVIWDGVSVMRVTYTHMYDNTEVIHWKGKMRHGPNEIFRENGTRICSLPYINDKLHGEVVYFHDNGKFHIKQCYSDGVKHGLCEDWFRSGQLYDRRSYVHGRVHGLMQSWFPNGKPQFEFTYRSNMRHGPEKSWHVNGNIVFDGVAINDRRHGLSHSPFKRGDPSAYYLSESMTLDKFKRKSRSLQRQVLLGMGCNERDRFTIDLSDLVTSFLVGSKNVIKDNEVFAGGRSPCPKVERKKRSGCTYVPVSRLIGQHLCADGRTQFAMSCGRPHGEASVMCAREIMKSIYHNGREVVQWIAIRLSKSTGPQEDFAYLREARLCMHDHGTLYRRHSLRRPDTLTDTCWDSDVIRCGVFHGRTRTYSGGENGRLDSSISINGVSHGFYDSTEGYHHKGERCNEVEFKRRSRIELKSINTGIGRRRQLFTPSMADLVTAFLIGEPHKSGTFSNETDPFLNTPVAIANAELFGFERRAVVE